MNSDAAQPLVIRCVYALTFTVVILCVFTTLEQLVSVITTVNETTQTEPLEITQDNQSVIQFQDNFPALRDDKPLKTTCDPTALYKTSTILATVNRTRKYTSTYNNCTDNFVINEGTELGNVRIMVNENNIGVMAVVQETHMNDSADKDCKNFFRFQSYDETTDKHCGDFVIGGLGGKIIAPSGVSHFSTDGKITMSYSMSMVSKQAVVESSSLFLHVIFTKVYQCPGVTTPNEVNMLPPQHFDKPLSQCSKLTFFSCIPSELFCDGIIHCADFGDGLGHDEKNCDKIRDVNNRSTGDYSREFIANKGPNVIIGINRDIGSANISAPISQQPDAMLNNESMVHGLTVVYLFLLAAAIVLVLTLATVLRNYESPVETILKGTIPLNVTRVVGDAEALRKVIAGGNVVILGKPPSPETRAKLGLPTSDKDDKIAQLSITQKK